MFKSIFILDGKFYEQCESLAMSSPLGPTLANVFRLENLPAYFKPIVSNDLLMIRVYPFEQRIMLKNLKIISTNNMKT